MEKERDSFVFYASYYEAIEYLPPEIQLEAYKAVCEYALTGIEPKGCNPIVKAIFTMAKPTVNSNLARRENGKMGGAPKGNQNARKNQVEEEKQPKTTSVDFENNHIKQPKNNLNNQWSFEKQPNENETVTETVTGNVYEKEKTKKEKVAVDNSSPPRYCPKSISSVQKTQFFISDQFEFDPADPDIQPYVQEFGESLIRDVEAWLKREKREKIVDLPFVARQFLNFAKRQGKYGNFEGVAA